MADDRLQFRVLGPARLFDAGGESVSRILASPKRLALFAYLCAASGPVGRDALAGLLWPEADQGHARNALNQLLHRVRRDIGRGAVESHGVELIGIDRERVWCDLAAFDAALEEERLEDAVQLYGGDVLEGFYLSGAPPFERWLENQRESYRNRAVAACRELAGRVAGTQPAEAVRRLRRALEIAPNREVLLRELLVRLDAVGNRAGAVKAYADFTRRLERDLETRPSPETVALMEKIVGRKMARGEPRLQPVPDPNGGSEVEASSSAVEREPGPYLPDRDTRSVHPLPRTLSVHTAITGALLLAAAAFTIFTFVRGTPEVDAAGDPPVELRDDVVLVVPFETTGPDVAYLGEGMIELLHMRFDGTGVPRQVDPATALSAWGELGDGGPWTPEVVLALGERTGAGRLVRGRVRATPSGPLMMAELIDTRSGELIETAEVMAVRSEDGALDLGQSIDRLVAELMAGSEEAGRVTMAGPTPSLPALKEYLAGRSAYRHAEVRTAVERYRRALDRDSTFAHAALGLLEAGWWPNTGSAFKDGRELSFRFEDRFGERDRTLLRALGGANFPESTDYDARRKAWERALELSPDRPTLLYQMGDFLFHRASVVQPEKDWRRAAALFERALAIDSTFAPPLDHLFKLALAECDVDRAAGYASLYGKRFPEGDATDAMTWALARVRQDTLALSEFWAGERKLSKTTLVQVFTWSHDLGVGLEDALLAFDELGRRVGGGAVPFEWFVRLNAGRPRAAAAAVSDRSEYSVYHEPISAALYSVGDTAGAIELARGIESEVDAPVPEADWDRVVRATRLFTMEQWKLWHGDRGSLARSMDRIRAIGDSLGHTDARRQHVDRYVPLLEALDSVLRGREDAADRVARADSVATGNWTVNGPAKYARLLVGRLYERLGDHEAALNVVRDHCWFCGGRIFYRADLLREEGRYAAALGDTAGALDAYTRYLALRGDPEPSVQPQVDSVRREMVRLAEPPPANPVQ